MNLSKKIKEKFKELFNAEFSFTIIFVSKSIPEENPRYS